MLVFEGLRRLGINTMGLVLVRLGSYKTCLRVIDLNMYSVLPYSVYAFLLIIFLFHSLTSSRPMDYASAYPMPQALQAPSRSFSGSPEWGGYEGYDTRSRDSWAAEVLRVLHVFRALRGQLRRCIGPIKKWKAW